MITQDLNPPVIVTYFQRPWALARCLKSIYDRRPNTHVIVIDDSSLQYRANLTPFQRYNIEHIVMPFDTGVCKKRNEGVRYCLEHEIESSFLMEEDMLWDERFDYDKLIRQWNDHPEYDILGVNVPGESDPRRFDIKPHPWEGWRHVSFPRTKCPPGKTIRCHWVPICFMQRNARVPLWDTETHIGDHLPFMMDSYDKGLVVMYNGMQTVDHKHVSAPHYDPYRNRCAVERQDALWRRKLTVKYAPNPPETYK